MPCPGCGREPVRRGRRGPPPKWCSPACRHRTARRVRVLEAYVSNWSRVFDVSAEQAELAQLQHRLAARA